MAKKPTIINVASGYQSTTTINNNFENTRNAFDNTLSLDGSVPNAMLADLDLNSNDILNASTIRTNSIFVNNVPVDPQQYADLNTAVASAEASADLAEGRADDIAALAGFRDFSSLTVLLANSTLTYSVGTNTTVVVDEIIRTRTEGFSYRVAASGATDHHISTAGGIKLYVVAGQSGYDVKAFGAKADGSDDSAAINKALGTGGAVRFPTGSYFVSGLTQSTAGQRLFADGNVLLIKNANGPLITINGDYVQLEGFNCFGTGYTGDNIVSNANHTRLIMCGSLSTSGVAARLYGDHSQIIGTCSAYATTDTTSSGYDIVIGTDGVATLYHQIVGVYTSQATGGIKFVDTGAAVVTGGQFGKLTTVQGSGGFVSGCNTGQYIGCRIVGNVSIGQSNGAFSACEFAGSSVTVANGCTGVNFDPSCVFSSGTTITNTNNFNNIILRNAFDGAAPSVHKLGIGGSSSLAWLGAEPANGKFYTPADMHIGYAVNAIVDIGGSANYGAVRSGTGGLYLGSNGATQFQVADPYFRPNADNTKYLGSASQRWNTVYAGTGTINTSDRNEKQQIDTLSDAEKAVGAELRGLIRKFKFNDAVAEKGDNARIHFGVIAQDIEAVFIAHGLDPSKYGLFCRDTWEAEDEVIDSNGNVISFAKIAGTRLGIRYDELIMFILGATQ